MYIIHQFSAPYRRYILPRKKEKQITTRDISKQYENQYYLESNKLNQIRENLCD
jgi:hypothetical protein